MQTYKTLFVGVGSIGERHLRCFLSTGRIQAWICEPNSPLRQRIAAQYTVGGSFSDLDAALTQPYDIAVIATPAHLHVPIALKLVEAGVHVLVEKPVSTSLDGIDDLRRLCVMKNVLAATAYVYRVNPSLAAMRSAIAKGQFGAPAQLIAIGGQHFPTYRPAYREIYYAHRQTGGGAIQDALTHLLNVGEWLVGPIDRVLGDASHQVLEGVAVEDTAHVLTRQGSVMGSYALNQYQAPNELTVTVVCERGAARFENHHSRWRWMNRPDTEWHDELSTKMERDGLYTLQAAAFLDAVEHKSPLPCTLEEGIQTLRVNLSLLEIVDTPAWRETSNDTSRKNQAI
jgi:predicted dehydrogenase